MLSLKTDLLTKSYGARRIFPPLSFCLAPGQLGLITGGNGSGKTTLLRILAGLARPSSGHHSLEKSGWHVAYSTADARLDPFLKCKELLQTRLQYKQNILEAYENWHLQPFMETRCEYLSSGQIKRLQHAICFHTPDCNLILLDEALQGLDDKGRQVLIPAMQTALERKQIILAATHQPEFYSALHPQLIELKS